MEEKITYYNEHVDEALEIVKHAHEYIAQFTDWQRGDIIFFRKSKKNNTFWESIPKKNSTFLE